MHPDTIVALEKSITKWENIVARKKTDQGSKDCSLCERFSDYRCTIEEDGVVVEECPVAIRAEDYGCSHTPYAEWIRAYPRPTRVCDPSEYTDEQILLAEQELDFLRSLLPKKRKGQRI